MFIKQTLQGCTRTGQQWAKGWFLALFSDRHNTYPGGRQHLYGVIRFVTLKQCGHWLMGQITVADCSITVSGAYGEDGSPIDLDMAYHDPGSTNDVYHGPLPKKAVDKLTLLPEELAETFWAGEGGHNTSGSEGPDIYAWAEKHFADLKKR